eukprot:CAMPEP_0206259870 /NCGR_PEP_ID=MMETSP0047_2-20121206/26744_1 /ASSEMBLY_ACC=CAM_ASM_000192 /TAXON_ID=195065 /ORGANISM="Chroomonas mesostigmatica_cf, Strain CCMP1168" /LENGTH=96 /DNA_ID=CAMNT_0053686831 /DNA_START=13 /DNA_END=303 /DNA_ORIENTATION=+
MLELLNHKQAKTNQLFQGDLSSNPGNLALEISKMSSSQIRQGLANDDCNKGLGICRTAQHSGKGWNSHGSVSCHSYGCAVNYARAPTGSGMAQAFH